MLTYKALDFEEKEFMEEKVIYSIVPIVTITSLLILLIGFVLRLPNTKVLNGVGLAGYPSDISVHSFWNGDFQTEFGKWFSDNFWGHSEIVECHNQIEYGLFNDGSGDWIQGRDGYIYSKSQSYSYVAGERANWSSFEDYIEYAKSVAEMQDMLNQ